MDLSSGKYLDHDIEAVSDDWLVVYDGKYNHYLFNAVAKSNRHDYGRNRMPSNNIGFKRTKTGGYESKKNTEFYSNFDNAVDNLVKVVANDGKWLTSARRVC